MHMRRESGNNYVYNPMQMKSIEFNSIDDEKIVIAKPDDREIP